MGGGQMYIVEGGATPKKRCSVKDHHFTGMGRTFLTGDLVMFVVILAGVVEVFNIETGIGVFADALND